MGFVFTYSSHKDIRDFFIQDRKNLTPVKVVITRDNKQIFYEYSKQGFEKPVSVCLQQPIMATNIMNMDIVITDNSGGVKKYYTTLGHDGRYFKFVDKVVENFCFFKEKVNDIVVNQRINFDEDGFLVEKSDYHLKLEYELDEILKDKGIVNYLIKGENSDELLSKFQVDINANEFQYFEMLYYRSLVKDGDDFTRLQHRGRYQMPEIENERVL